MEEEENNKILEIPLPITKTDEWYNDLRNQKCSCPATKILPKTILFLKKPKNLKSKIVRLNTSVSQLKLRASLCKILISSFAHKMDFAHNFSVDFF